MAELKVGFVGSGGMAKAHMRQLGEAEAAITAICDVNKEAAKAACDEFGGKAYSDHHAMLDAEELDVVYVVVPPFAHTDAEVLAAQKGCHLFVEKPVVLDTDKGLEIQEAIEKAGVLSCVGYQLRYADPILRARKWLQGKTIAMVDSQRWGGLPGAPWWRVMAESGGQLVEQTTHQVDIMRFIAGEIVNVFAMYALRCMGDVENLDIPDTQCTMFEFESGALGMVSTTPMMTQGGGRGGCEVLLRDQRLIVDYGSVRLEPENDPALEPPYEPSGNIDKVFVEAIQADDQSRILSSYYDGLVTCDATLAANESAQTGKPVKPRLAPG